MSHPNLLSASDCALVIVDLQTRLMNAVVESDRVLANAVRLIECAKVFSVPVIATTQIADKLGAFSEPVASAFADVEFMDKTTFSCAGCPGFLDTLSGTSRKQILLCGVETHVCVNQTAHDLLAEGYQVHVVGDAVSSRTPENRSAGIGKMRDSGCIITSTEMAIFELTRDAAVKEFRSIYKLVK